MNLSTHQPSPLTAALSPRPSAADEISTLWAMSAAERVAAMWRGELTLAQLCAWSSHRPNEVPLLSGEFAWIVIREPGWAEATETSTKAVR